MDPVVARANILGYEDLNSSLKDALQQCLQTARSYMAPLTRPTDKYVHFASCGYTLRPRCLHAAARTRSARATEQASRTQAAVSRRRRNFARDPAIRAISVPTFGFFTVLHSWDQRLQFHPHVHCVVAAGALAPNRS